MCTTDVTTIVDMTVSVSKALMLVHSVDTCRKRITYYRYVLKDAMNVKATSIAREAREKNFLRPPPPLNFEVRGGEFFITAPLDFCQGGGANTP